MPEWEIGERVICLRKPGFAHAYGRIGTVVDYDETPGLYSKYAVEVPTASGTTLVPVAGHELRLAPLPGAVLLRRDEVSLILRRAELRSRYTRSNGKDFGFEVTEEPDAEGVLVRWHSTAHATALRRLEQCAAALEAEGLDVRRLEIQGSRVLAVVRYGG